MTGSDCAEARFAKSFPTNAERLSSACNRRRPLAVAQAAPTEGRAQAALGSLRLVARWLRDADLPVEAPATTMTSPGQPRCEEMLVVDRGGTALKLPASLDVIPVRIVAAAEWAAAAVRVSNWLRMIPVITATRGLTPRGLTKSLLALVDRPLALSFIEHEMSVGDPSVVRSTIFDLLRTGHLRAPILHTHPLSLHTAVEPRA